MTGKDNKWQKHVRPVSGHHKMAGLVKALEKLARKLKPGARLPRMRELAEALGVTLATLDQGLTQLERRGLLDRRPRSGVFVTARVEQKTVGMVIGWNIFSAGDDAAFYSLLLEGCARVAQVRGRRFSWFLDYLPREQVEDKKPSVAPVHQDLVDALADGRLDGLLLASPNGPYQEKWLRGQGVPLVCLSPGRDEGIVIDTDATVRIALEEFTRQGVRKIGFICPLPIHTELFRRAAKDFNLSIEEAWLSERGHLPEGTRYDLEGRACAQQLLERAKAAPKRGLPEALIITDDVLTRGACGYFAENGVKIGTQLKVISQSNKGSPVLGPWLGQVTRCEFDPQEIATALFTRLESLMAGEKPEKRVVIRPTLWSL